MLWPDPVESTADLLLHVSTLTDRMTIKEGGCGKIYALSRLNNGPKMNYFDPIQARFGQVPPKSLAACQPVQ
jgi:hypothetical protein